MDSPDEIHLKRLAAALVCGGRLTVSHDRGVERQGRVTVVAGEPQELDLLSHSLGKRRRGRGGKPGKEQGLTRMNGERSKVGHSNPPGETMGRGWWVVLTTQAA